MYLKNDVLLLTDVVQLCIKTCKSSFRVIPLYSFCTSGFTGTAELEYTGGIRFYSRWQTQNNTWK